MTPEIETTGPEVEVVIEAVSVAVGITPAVSKPEAAKDATTALSHSMALCGIFRELTVSQNACSF